MNCHFWLSARPFFCLINLIFFVISVSAEVPPGKSDAPNSPVSFAPVEAKLQQSGGSLTPEVRAAYLDWAQQTVLRQLSDLQQTIPADCLAEVQGDPTLRDAIFGSFDPPDSSILQNYAELRAELGPDFMAKYRSLVLATAVAVRSHGAKVLPYSYIGAPLAPPPSKEKSPEQIEDDRLAAALGEFMTKNSVSALDLYQNPTTRLQLPDFLRSEHFDDKRLAEIDNRDRLWQLLRQAMVILGQRPAHREQAPDLASWLRHLASIYEARPASLPKVGKEGKTAPWPRFPMDQAPWPLLMPLYHPYPLGEAQYIWEKYQGQHGPDFYHTYGPYETGQPEMVRELQPSPWNWRAWPDILVHGGDCTPMAPMAVETHVALVEPAVMAGQPGHCNLLAYKNADGFWWLDIEQAFAGGPNVTWGAWLFNEVRTAPYLGEQNGGPWAQAEYQLGLAQAMNVGLASYIDTRMAVNIFTHLSDAEKASLGATLLQQATQTNPFNPVPWRFLAKQTVDAKQGFDLVKLAMANKECAFSGKTAAAAYPKPERWSLHAYWGCLLEHLVQEAILTHPAPQDSNLMKEMYPVLKSQGGGWNVRLMPYRLQAEGFDGVEAELMADVHKHLKESEKGYPDKGKKQFETEMKAFLVAIGNEERDAFLVRLKATFPPGTTDDDPYLSFVEAVQTKSP